MTPDSAARSGRSLIGLSTYAYLWQWSDQNPAPMTLEQMLRDAAAHGAEAFQICDYPPLAAMSPDELRGLRALSHELGLVLEVGTRGVRPEVLLRHLEIAQDLGSSYVRSMIQPEDTPLHEVAQLLTAALPTYAQAGVELGLETYEQVPTAELVAVVEQVDHPSLGIVLDPGNSVAALEHPAEVVARTAAHVNNLHIKDFGFSRQQGWVGFLYAGARLGEGLLDYEGLLTAVEPHRRGISQIIEHWLPWQGDIEETVRIEQDWIRHNISYLRSRNA